MFKSGAVATHLHILPRSLAKQLGVATYGTGAACKRGHIDWRTTSDGSCLPCGREKMQRRRAARRKEVLQLREQLIEKARREFSGTTHANRRLIPRWAALQIGLKTYYTGVECDNGHDCDRRVSCGLCVECSRQFGRDRYRKSPEEYSRQHKLWRAANPDYRAQYRAANPRLYKALQLKRDMRRRDRMAGGVSTRELKSWLQEQPKICHWCGAPCKESYHIDHYHPLARGGRHDLGNLVIACPPCNLAKSAKDPYEFAASLGRLF